MRFSLLYEELKFYDVFKKASPEEAKDRLEKYAEMKLKEAFDNVKKTKLPDGSWHIHGSLIIDHCGLTSLKDLNVSIIDGEFDCSRNKLTSLEGAPKKVTVLYCKYNELTDLNGCPESIKQSVSISSNKLTSLEGCPRTINADFDCSSNQLTSLIGGPERVKFDFNCSHNNLTSLEGAPKYVGFHFRCDENTKKFSKIEVEEVSAVQGYIVV